MFCNISPYFQIYFLCTQGFLFFHFDGNTLTECFCTISLYFKEFNDCLRNSLHDEKVDIEGYNLEEMKGKQNDLTQFVLDES